MFPNGGRWAKGIEVVYINSVGQCFGSGDVFDGLLDPNLYFECRSGLIKKTMKIL